MPFVASQQPTGARRLSAPACSVMSASQPPANPLPAPVRPLVRSAGCVQLQAEPVQAAQHYRVYASDEDDSGDEAGSSSSSSTRKAALASVGVSSLLPSYASVYSSIRQAAVHQAQRQRNRQMELTQLSAVWEQHKRDAPVEEAATGLAVVHAKRSLVSPAIRSTLSTASESSQLSAYSSDGGSGCDTDSEREATNLSRQQQQQQPRGSHQQPQHFTFSVDDIDKALTEEELDEWFNTDEQTQRQHDDDEDNDDDEDDKSDEDEQQQQQRPALYSHVAVRSPLFVPSSTSSLSCSSSSTTPIKPHKPRLSINTASTGCSVNSDNESTITVLPAATSSSSSTARRFLRSSQPSTFTFSRPDIRKSTDTPTEELHVGHWSTFPRPSVPVCDVRALRGRLREKRDEWDRQALAERVEQSRQASKSCQGEEKREAARKPAAARRLFVESAGSAGAARSRQSVVMWRRDSHSHTAQVAPLPLPAPLLLPVPSPPNDGRSTLAAGAAAAQQHRRAATAYSCTANPHVVHRRAQYQYQSASLLHFHAQQQQQQQLQRQQMIHAAYVSAANRAQQPTPHYQLQHQPQQQQQQPSQAHSDALSLVSSPDRQPAYPRMAYTAYPTSHTAYSAPPYTAQAAPASDLFSPRTVNKPNQWRTAAYQPIHAYAMHSQHDQQQQQQQQPAHCQPHSSYQPFDIRPGQHYTADYYSHYSPYLQDALHSLKPAGPACPSHALPHDVLSDWLTLQHANNNQPQPPAGHTLERCVSAVATTTHSASSTHSRHHHQSGLSYHQQHHQQQQHQQPAQHLSLPAAARHTRVISAPQRYRLVQQ